MLKVKGDANSNFLAFYQHSLLIARLIEYILGSFSAVYQHLLESIRRGHLPTRILILSTNGVVIINHKYIDLEQIS